MYNTLEYEEIHTYNPDNENDDEEDEDIGRTQREIDAWVREQKALLKPDYCNGNKEVVKIFNQFCVIRFETNSVYAFQKLHIIVNVKTVMPAALKCT